MFLICTDLLFAFGLALRSSNVFIIRTDGRLFLFDVIGECTTITLSRTSGSGIKSLRSQRSLYLSLLYTKLMSFFY